MNHKAITLLDSIFRDNCIPMSDANGRIYDALRAELAKPAPVAVPFAVPEGWQLVPKKPAPEMILALKGKAVTTFRGSLLLAGPALEAAIAAAPHPPAPAVDVEAVRNVIDWMRDVGSDEEMSRGEIYLWADQLARAIGDET